MYIDSISDADTLALGNLDMVTGASIQKYVGSSCPGWKSVKMIDSSKSFASGDSLLILLLTTVNIYPLIKGGFRGGVPGAPPPPPL